MKIYPQENVYYRFEEETPYLIGSRCKNCGYAAFPKRVVCPACVTRESTEEIRLSRRGKIKTFSVLHVGAPGFATPYIVGYVALPEGPEIFSMISGCEPSEDSLDIGEEMELILGKIRDDEQGNEVMGYQFRPVAK